MIHISDRVWLGLRLDGVELARIPAACLETGRANGIATYRITGTAVITDIPSDFGPGEALLTIHDGENLPPFSAMRVDLRIRTGESLSFTDLKFEVLIDVPKYVKPGKPKRWGTRLSRD